MQLVYSTASPNWAHKIFKDSNDGFWSRKINIKTVEKCFKYSEVIFLIISRLFLWHFVAIQKMYLNNSKKFLFFLIQKEKENSEFKPALLHSKIDLVSHPANGREVR